MAVCCDAGGTWTGESVWTARDGKAVPVLVSAAPFYDEQGKLAGMVTVSTDLTARKQLEEELRQAHKLEAVGKLAGGIAHDFNNLLTAINGYSHLLLHQLDENDTRRARVREIHHAGERAAELTQQLLAFSRKQILQPKIIDLNAAIVGMEQLLRSSVGENIHLQMHLATQECKVKTDPGQITQVVLNLVVNARDAMPRGGILNIETVQVYLNYKRAHQHGLSGAGNFVKLLVSDTGQGMDEETRARIFEPFFTTKEQGQGTGLGLATVYGIIRQSGGSIQVESKIGAGTRFSIYLPLAEEHEEELLPLTETTLSLTPVAETILLVEDEEQVRELLTNLLREQGYQVLPACDGAEACRLCQQQPVDLLLTDIVLPNESGYELAAQVSALCPEVKVLYMSGYVEQTGRQPEAAMFLQKPFPLDELLSKIRTALKAEAAEAQVLQVAAS
jgi:signal transduction histidine kinase/ActR/RegA family two-component response regulator